MEEFQPQSVKKSTFFALVAETLSLSRRASDRFHVFSYVFHVFSRVFRYFPATLSMCCDIFEQELFK